MKKTIRANNLFSRVQSNSSHVISTTLARSWTRAQEATTPTSFSSAVYLLAKLPLTVWRRSLKETSVLMWLVAFFWTLQVTSLNWVSLWQRQKCFFKLYLFTTWEIKFAELIINRRYLLCSSGNADSCHWITSMFWKYLNQRILRQILKYCVSLIFSTVSHSFYDLNKSSY